MFYYNVFIFGKRYTINDSVFNIVQACTNDLTHITQKRAWNILRVVTTRI